MHGTKFHRFARELVDGLKTASFELSADDLYRRMTVGDAGAFVEQLLKEGQVDGAAAFLDALRHFCRRIVELRQRAPQASAWSEIFVANEYGLRDVRFETPSRLVFVSGVMDGLRAHPTGAIEVVDYKLTEGEHLERELVQIALYRYLLRSQNPELRVCGALEYFQPRFHAVEASDGQLSDIFGSVVAPVLHEIAEHYAPSASTRAVPVSPLAATPPEPQARPAESEAPCPPPRSSPKPASKPGSTERLKVGRTRTREPTEVELPFAALIRHTAVLGGSGSGKTTLALNLLEQLLLGGIPVVMVDRKGDLCRYADPTLASEPALTSFFSRVRVELFTPGNPAGRPLSIALIPDGLESLDAMEREKTFRSAAQGIGSMMGLKSSARDQARIAVLVRALQALKPADAGHGASIADLVDLLGNPDPGFLETLEGMDTKHLGWLAEQLQTLNIMKGELFHAGGERLSAELLFGHRASHSDSKTPLSIISTKFLGDEETALFWVAQLLIELQRFASRSPRKELQAVVMFDEADLYLPAVGKPVTKGPMESLLKRARSAGIGLMLVSQSPGDFDYKSRENIRTWFMGLIKQKPALEKLRAVVAETRLEPDDVLPKQKVGEFFLVSEKNATAIKSERSLVETEQMSEVEILELAKRRN